jgi:alpha-L-rhamnosidase
MIAWSLIALCGGFPAAASETAPALDLKTCGLVNPAAIDRLPPTLSWRMQSARQGAAQTAWRVLAASTPDQLAADEGDLWDSGEVVSDQSLFISYQGKTPAAGQDVWWKVKLRDETGQWSDWSQLAKWRAGLLDISDWRGAQWIGLAKDTRDSPLKWRNASEIRLGPARNNPRPPKIERRTVHPSPMLRREFTLAKPIRRATAHVCGLGYFELHVNGRRAGDHVLDPTQTSYDKRAFYVTHDVTPLLDSGKNALGLMLGNGFFGQNFALGGNLQYGPPRAKILLDVEYADGSRESVVSGPDWKASTGPVVFDNVYVGESYDARLEQAGWDRTGFDDHAWQDAAVMEAPTNVLFAQNVEPMRRIREVKPVALLPGTDGAWILDMGQNMTGWLRIRVNEPAGTEIRMIFTEHLTPCGKDVDPASTGIYVTRGPQHDIYLCKGGGVEEWEPRFTYHGFRYVRISGLGKKPELSDFTGYLVRTDAPLAGTFESSDPVLNRFHEVSLWTLEGNMQGVLTDCPHRERCGWLGDTHAVGEYASYALALQPFWGKTMEDIRTVLGTATRLRQPGARPDPRAPGNISVGKRMCGEARPDWGAAVVLVPWINYLFYGDLDTVRAHWDMMCGWIDFVEEQHVKNGIVHDGFGDWCPPGSNAVMDTPPPLTSTALHFQALQAMAHLAVKTGRNDEAQRFGKLAARTKTAFNRRFSIPGGGYGSQTATAMALRLGLVPPARIPAAVDSLEDAIMNQAGGAYTTGIFGHRHLYTALNDHGRQHITRHLWSRSVWPSLRFLTEEHGLTTWPEVPRDWPKDQPYTPNSFNHPMHSGFAATFYESLGGIRPDSDAPGFRKIILHPTFVDGIEWVNVTHDSPYGTIASSWKRANDGVEWSFTIPANTSAELRIPAADGEDLLESGKHVRFLRSENGRAVFECAAGSYTIRIPES